MRIRLMMAGAVCALLSSCAPVLLRNPTTGARTQCLAQGAYPLINRQQCISSYEEAGWVRSTAAQADQADRADAQMIRQRDAQLAAAVEQCRNASHLAFVQCANPKIREAYNRSGYPNMDLINIALASREVDAEKIDKGTMTEAEASLHMAEVASQITTAENQRIADIVKSLQAPRPVTTTNCTPLGNSANCTTY